MELSFAHLHHLLLLIGALQILSSVTHGLPLPNTFRNAREIGRTENHGWLTAIRKETTTLPDMSLVTKHPINLSAPIVDPPSAVPTLSANASSRCYLHPRHIHGELNTYDKIVEAVESSNAKLLEYVLLFPEYPENPLPMAHTRRYKIDVWQRLLDSYGESLLNLVFNYDVLSLGMLTFKNEKISVELVDSPHKCFISLSPDEKYARLLELITHDFNIDSRKGPHFFLKDALWQNSQNKACHQIMKTIEGNTKFTYRCCQRRKSSLHAECHDLEAAWWAKAIQVMLLILKVLFWAFGPILLYTFILRDTVLSRVYHVNLEEWFDRTLTVEDDDGIATTFKKNKKKFQLQDKLDQYKSLKEVTKGIKSDSAKFFIKEVKVSVTHTKLLTETDVPAGLLNYIYRNFILCHCRTINPFYACCKKSIFGSWNGFFLCKEIYTDDRKDTPTGEATPKESKASRITWRSLARGIGAILTFLLIPFPYYIRLICYYAWEAEENNARQTALQQLNLTSKYSSETEMIQHFGPLHPVYITLYVSYFLSGLILFLIRLRDPEHFDTDLLDCLHDLKSVNITSCIRLLMSHILLPFEKYGILSCCVNVLYLMIAVPLCLMVIMVYCVPIFYITFRLLCPQRPDWLKRGFLDTREESRELPNETPKTVLEPKNMHILSDGTKNLESALLLEDISPTPNIVPPNYNISDLWKRYRKSKGISNKIRLVLYIFLELLRRVLMVIWIYCFMFMYSECFVYLVHILVLTAMGAIVNSDAAGKFIVLCSLALGYAGKCYGDSYQKYVLLNKAIFKHIKEKLDKQIKATAIKPRSEQFDTAFCFYTEEELNKRHMSFTDAGTYKGRGEADDFNVYVYFERKKLVTYMNRIKHVLKTKVESKRDSYPEAYSLEEDDYIITIMIRRDEEEDSEIQRVLFDCKFTSEGTYEGRVEVDGKSARIRLKPANLCLPNADHFLTRHGELFWHTNNLVLFLDEDDTPRIPEKLFFALTQFEAPGCPGPIYKSLAEATVNFLKLILFLCFVMIVVVSFSSAHKVSSTNQMLATVAGGILPFLLGSLFGKSGNGGIDLDTYRFQGQIHDILARYHQKWTVHDMELERHPSSKEDVPERENGQTQKEWKRISFDGPPIHDEEVHAKKDGQTKKVTTIFQRMTTQNESGLETENGDIFVPRRVKHHKGGNGHNI